MAPIDTSPNASKAAFGLTDQLAIVTGASSGRARAAIREFLMLLMQSLAQEPKKIRVNAIAAG